MATRTFRVETEKGPGAPLGPFFFWATSMVSAALLEHSRAYRVDDCRS